MFLTPKLPGATAALVSYDADPTLIDLDDAAALVERRLRPSQVASRDREITQGWARAVYAEGRWDGIRWWSILDARWGVLGLWTVARVHSAEPAPLSRRHPAVRKAAEILGKQWVS